MKRMVHRLGLLFCLLLFACSRGETPATSSGADPGVTIQPFSGWEIYYSDGSVLRLRKLNAEAILDISMVPLGPGSAYPDFESFYRQFSHVGLPSVITDERDVTIDGTAARRISFSGQRPDTGVPNAGVRYLMELNGKAYQIVFLDAGRQIERNRGEAETMIDSIRFRR